MEKITLGVSACLLGQAVRYDGGHRRDRFVADVLGQYMAYVPVCPEVECGLPVPRESMHLVGDVDHPRLVTTRTEVDHTRRMETWARRRVRELESAGLCGFIFKSRSPSSGMQRVRVTNDKGQAVKKGVGVFARIFQEHFPLLPAEDEGRLNDADIRENFIERVFTLKRWRDVLARGRTRARLVAFHTQHKLLIMSHSQKHATEMGRLVSHAKAIAPSALFRQYEALLMEALRRQATVRRHVNVLQHAAGYFKRDLSPDEKQELVAVIDRYRSGYVPLIVPVTLLDHYVRKYDQPYLKQQVYLHPHPIELRLRNHV